jgi:hypothetical protein
MHNYLFNRSIDHPRTYCVKGDQHTKMYQLEFERIDNKNDVASIFWTEIPPRDLICHARK